MPSEAFTTALTTSQHRSSLFTRDCSSSFVCFFAYNSMSPSEARMMIAGQPSKRASMSGSLRAVARRRMMHFEDFPRSILIKEDMGLFSHSSSASTTIYASPTIVNASSSARSRSVYTSRELCSLHRVCSCLSFSNTSLEKYPSCRTRVASKWARLCSTRIL